MKCEVNLRDIYFEIFHGYWPIFDCGKQGLKMYELVLFNNILVQLFSSSFVFFILDFPCRRLSITFDIQTDL